MAFVPAAFLLSAAFVSSGNIIKAQAADTYGEASYGEEAQNSYQESSGTVDNGAGSGLEDDGAYQGTQDAGSGNSSEKLDMEYQGPVDIYTGEPLTGEDSSSAENVTLPDGSVYSRSAHSFTYASPDGTGSISSTVPDGTITTESVSIVPEDDMEVNVYNEGESIDEDMSAISKEGSYSVVTGSSGNEQVIMTFEIVPEKTGKLTAYTLPEGFTLQSIIINGESQPINSARYVDFTNEGVYEVDYQCEASGVSYELILEIDHTYPEITITGTTDGIARGPVTVEGIEEGDTVTVLKDGEGTSLPQDNTLRSVGKYTVTVSDDAGNASSVEFEIRLYLNWQGGAFFAAAAGVVAAAIIYMYVSRKRLRVR